MTEQQRHTVVRAFPGFDVRRYPDSVVVQVLVAGDFAPAARLGSRLLRRYLAATYRSAHPVDPKAPVLLERAGESQYLVSVALPDLVGLLDPGTVPASAVTVRARPGHEAAVLPFLGGLGTERFAEQGRDLLSNVRAGGLEPVGAVYFARFFAAWKPGFLSRNEALVWVTSA